MAGRTCLASLCLLVFALSGALGWAPAPKVKQKGPVYNSPEAVFEAYIRARDELDARTEIGCLTPRAQKAMALGFAWSGVKTRARLERWRNEDKKTFQQSWEATRPIREVLDRHGLTEQATKGVKPFGSDEDFEKGSAVLAGLIKDYVAFAADFRKALDKISEAKPDRPHRCTLENVKIDGDRAKGTWDGFPFRFEKINGSWRILTHGDPAEDDADWELKLDKLK